MSEPAAQLRTTLRVAIRATDEARRARLATLLSRLQYRIVESPEEADVVLIDGDFAVQTVSPVVSIGGEGETAGLLPSGANDAQIDAALRAAASGLRVRVAEQGFDAMAESRFGPLLTPREIEVLIAMADGQSNKEIARRLGISLHTVKFHVEAIFRKLEVRSRAGAVARGLQRFDL